MSLNSRNIIFWDTETGGLDPKRCQPTQIAAVAIDGFTLELKPNGIFNSEIRPIFDPEECAKLGIDEIHPKALEVTKKTREGLMKAPSLKAVWKDWTTFVRSFNPGKSPFTAPIGAGFNIINYDNFILQRLCTEFGDVDKGGKQNLFHQINKIDLMDMCWTWLENIPEVTKCNMDYLREFFGFPQNSKDHAHDALQDVKDGANILIKFMKFQRSIASAKKFGGAFANGEFYVK